jgi:hypothetical protein
MRDILGRKPQAGADTSTKEPSGGPCRDHSTCKSEKTEKGYVVKTFAESTPIVPASSSGKTGVQKQKRKSHSSHTQTYGVTEAILEKVLKYIAEERFSAACAECVDHMPLCVAAEDNWFALSSHLTPRFRK